MIAKYLIGIALVTMSALCFYSSSYARTQGEVSVVAEAAIDDDDKEPVVEQTASPIFMSPGEFDSRLLGWNWGLNSHKNEVVIVFEKSNQDLSLSVTGYDIDNPSEVYVLFNGSHWGSISKGENNALNLGDTFTFNFADQIVGENKVQFVQQSPGLKWGITNINLSLLSTVTSTQTIIEVLEETKAPKESKDLDAESDSSLSGRDNVVELTLGQGDENSYGWGWGSRGHREEVVIQFRGVHEDLNLSVTGYDIDSPGEIDVLFNGDYWGRLSQGSNNALNDGDVFRINRGDQSPETNQIRFVQSTSGWKWGVTNLLLKPLGTSTLEKSVIATPENEETERKNISDNSFELSEGMPDNPATLQAGILNEKGYGYVWGSRTHQEEAVFSFTVKPGLHALQVFGYDIDFADEVSVLLNNVVIGYLSQGASDTLNEGDIFEFENESAVQENILRFVQKSPKWKWGVTNILLSDTFISDTAPPIELQSESTPVISVADSSKVADAKTRNVTHDKLPKKELTTEDQFVKQEINQVVIAKATERQKSLEGVEMDKISVSEQNVETTIELANLETDLILQKGVKNDGKFGYYFGKKKYREELRVAIPNTGTDLKMTVSGYSIDDDTEVQLLFNGVEFGYLNSGPDGEALVTTSLQFPQNILNPGYNLLVFRQQKPGWKWGVTDLYLEATRQ